MTPGQAVGAVAAPAKSTATKPRLAPAPLGLAPSFGFGDRLGLATPGHVAALRDAGGPILGVFAQQSVREMTRTGRSAETIMRAAADALAALDYRAPWSADADHLTAADDIRHAMAAGLVLFTLDPSDDVDQLADSYDWATLEDKFQSARNDSRWVELYRGKSVSVGDCVIEFDDQVLHRAAVKYGKALKRAIAMAQTVEEEAAARGQAFEIELSIDETAQPTTPAEHYIIADQFRKADIKLASLAPRFIGDFEKGVDYKGDLAALEQSMHLHAAIAERLGPYKLSLHSGSDKLSMYPALARATGGRFHVKTSGTSYLEALRVAAQQDPSLFRQIVTFSRSRFEQDKASYHVSAVVNEIPSPDEVDDPVILERLYLDRWEDAAPGRGFTEPGRQVLHCTFGSVYTNPQLGPRLLQLLQAYPAEHCEILRQHFVRHLEPLRAG
jgi:hypothetical protein